MKKALGTIKTTALGGLLFLLPVAVLLYVLGKIAGIMRAAASPLDGVVPMETPLGVILVNALGVLVIFALCYLAGLLAARGFGRGVVQSVESTLVGAVPGYTLIKGVTESMARGDAMAESMKPVLACFDDNAQIAFEIDRTAAGNVVVYLPGAPNPWSGSVVYMTADRVHPLEISVGDAIKSIRSLGRGTAPANLDQALVHLRRTLS